MTAPRVYDPVDSGMLGLETISFPETATTPPFTLHAYDPIDYADAKLNGYAQASGIVPTSGGIVSKITDRATGGLADKLESFGWAVVIGLLGIGIALIGVYRLGSPVAKKLV